MQYGAASRIQAGERLSGLYMESGVALMVPTYGSGWSDKSA